MQEDRVRQPTMLRLPEGLSASPPAKKAPRPKRASQAALHARTCLALRTLEHLPVAVAVIGPRLTMHYWNPHAAHLLNLPPAMRDDLPNLGDALRDGGRLSTGQMARILGFCEAATNGEATELSWLRISLGRQHRLAVKLHAMGGERWILAFEELHPISNASNQGADAMVDPLTGLGNRRHFADTLQVLFPEAGGSPGGPPGGAAVLLIDLDRFQTVNDTLGRTVGDGLLSLVAQRLRRETRDDDMVARLGGDEFAVLQPKAGDDAVLARRLVEVIGRPFLIEGHVVNIGASVGIARLPSHGGSVDALMKQAYIALYAAKAAGRQTWRLFDPGMTDHATARRGLEADLRNAIALGEVSLAYRPQREAATGRLTGFAASPNWIHPARGPVPETVFMPLAEDIGLAADLRAWVLKAACADAARWSANLTVSAEVSASQLDWPDRIVATVRDALAASGLAPERLVIGLHGGALKSRERLVSELIEHLHALGVGVSMTAYVANWGALRQLRVFRFDRMKIGHPLVAALHTDPETAAIVRAMTTLADDLGMIAMAEGVETPEQAAILSEQKCGVLEGDLVGAVMDAAAVADLPSGATGA
jgi:diguanylate cyclase (GGDEF)-like protein